MSMLGYQSDAVKFQSVVVMHAALCGVPCSLVAQGEESVPAGRPNKTRCQHSTPRSRLDVSQGGLTKDVQINCHTLAVT